MVGVGGVAGALGWDGAMRLQWLHCWWVAWMAGGDACPKYGGLSVGDH